jgi:hypothetical protein
MCSIDVIHELSESLSMCSHSSVDYQNFSANLMVYMFCSGFVVGKALNNTPAQGGS